MNGKCVLAGMHLTCDTTSGSKHATQEACGRDCQCRTEGGTGHPFQLKKAKTAF